MCWWCRLQTFIHTLKQMVLMFFCLFFFPCKKTKLDSLSKIQNQDMHFMSIVRCGAGGRFTFCLVYGFDFDALWMKKWWEFYRFKPYFDRKSITAASISIFEATKSLHIHCYTSFHVNKTKEHKIFKHLFMNIALCTVINYGNPYFSNSHTDTKLQTINFNI